MNDKAKTTDAWPMSSPQPDVHKPSTPRATARQQSRAIEQLGRRFLDASRSPRARHLLALALALLPAVLLSPAIIREIPLSRDHATHLFKVWHFWTEMVPSGRVRGWSPYWAFGFPSDELVPCGGELWVGLFRALTLGQLPWDRTYAVAFAGLMLFKSYAAFAFTRSFFGVAAGVVCAWITLLDPGGMLEGGWNWHTYWGVWPVTLAASLSLLALVKLEHVLRHRRGSDVLCAGLWFAAALVTHQLSLVLFAVVTPLLFFDHLLRDRRPALGAYVQAGIALALGTALVSFYLVPFMARTGETMNLGWLHEPLSEISRRFVHFETFQGVWRPVHALGILGGLWALAKRRPGGVLSATAAALCVVLASDTLVRDLHLERALPSIIKVEVNRMLLVGKLFWFPLAGYAFIQLGKLLLDAGRGLPRWHRYAHGGVGAALAIALLVPGFGSFYETQIKKEVTGQDEQRYWADYQPFLEWSRQLRDSTPELYRIAYDMWRGDHLSTVMPVYNRTPIYKLGYTPTQIYNKLPMRGDADIFRAANVKYVVSARPSTWSKLKLERTFGKLYVYSFVDYTSDPFTLLGPGYARLLEFSPERMRIQLTQTSPESRLKLHVGSYPRWQASIAGQLLPIATVTVGDAHDPYLMEVPARDGELLVEYVYRWSDWLGLLLSLGALPVFAAVWWVERRRPFFDAASHWVERRGRWFLLGAGAVLLTIGLVVAWRMRTRVHMLPGASLFQRADLQMDLAGAPCERVAPLEFQCGSHAIRAETVSDSLWGVHLCIQAPEVGSLHLRVPEYRHSFVRGFYAVPKDKSGTLRAALGEEPLGDLETRPHYLRRQFVQFDTRSTARGAAPFEIWVTGAALNCFDFETVE